MLTPSDSSPSATWALLLVQNQSLSGCLFNIDTSHPVITTTAGCCHCSTADATLQRTSKVSLQKLGSARSTSFPGARQNAATCPKGGTAFFDTLNVDFSSSCTFDMKMFSCWRLEPHLRNALQLNLPCDNASGCVLVQRHKVAVGCPSLRGWDALSLSRASHQPCREQG